jgi:hypothetical protein
VGKQASAGGVCLAATLNLMIDAPQSPLGRLSELLFNLLFIAET